MTTDERMMAFCLNIIDLCTAALVIMGHVDSLRNMDDHPAVRGLRGAIDSIEKQAQALMASEP